MESLATLTFAVAALTGGASLSYAAFSRLYLKHAAYELAICLSTPQSIYQCERTFRSDVAQALPIGRIETLRSARDQAHVEIRGRFKISDRFLIPIDDVRSLPLLTDSTREGLSRWFL